MKAILQKINLIPDKTDLKSWLIAYMVINFVFLYHTLNFMWGNHDVQFVKSELLLSSGLFEGRFTQFIPYRLFVNGQILPILNNLFGFLFLTLGLWMLAKYWNIPKTLTNYTLFIIFFATEPYTLSWLYFTHYTISCLLWVFVAVLGLYLAEYIKDSAQKLTLSIISTLCFYVTLGGYPPIINTFFVCLAGRLTIAYLFEKQNIKTLFHTYKYTLLNIIITAVLFKLTLKLVNPNNVYNLETTPLSDIFSKFFETIKISLNQFTLTLPFMEKGYKTLLLLLVITAFIGALIKAPTLKNRLITFFLISATVWAASLTTFVSVPHTEYVARIDFYGLAFVYAFALALLLKYKRPLSQSLCLIFMLLLIPLNVLNDYRALKIWQQGFEAEFQILEQITERIENHPNFNPNTKYHFYQIGDISLRRKYYHEKFDKNEPFLLNLPYLAMWQGGPLLEFYSPFNYIDHTTSLSPDDITPDVYNFIIHEAKPWPHPNSIFIKDNVLLVVYNQIGLNEFQNKIKNLYL